MRLLLASNKFSSPDPDVIKTIGVGVWTLIITGLIGLGFWHYKKNKEEERYRQRFPLANKLRKKLELTEVNDFLSPVGNDYLLAVNKIEDELKKIEMNTSRMKSEEIMQLAEILALEVRAYTYIELSCNGKCKKNHLDENALTKDAQNIAEMAKTMFFNEKLKKTKNTLKKDKDIAQQGKETEHLLGHNMHSICD